MVNVVFEICGGGGTLEKNEKKWLYIAKRIPFLALIACVALQYGLLIILPDNAGTILTDEITPVLYIISFVCLFFIRGEENGDYSLIKLSLIGKIALIPWFGLSAFFATILLWGGFIIPINWFGLPVLFIMNLLMLAITSLYSILGIQSFYKKNQMPLKNILIVSQCFFVVDVIGIVAAFMQSKKRCVKKTKER